MEQQQQVQTLMSENEQLKTQVMVTAFNKICHTYYLFHKIAC